MECLSCSSTHCCLPISSCSIPLSLHSVRDTTAASHPRSNSFRVLSLSLIASSFCSSRSFRCFCSSPFINFSRSTSRWEASSCWVWLSTAISKVSFSLRNEKKYEQFWAKIILTMGMPLPVRVELSLHISKDQLLFCKIGLGWIIHFLSENVEGTCLPLPHQNPSFPTTFPYALCPIIKAVHLKYLLEEKCETELEGEAGFEMISYYMVYGYTITWIYGILRIRTFNYNRWTQTNK